MMEIKPGIYPGMSNKDYHGHHTSYSKSSLADFSVYPYNLIYQRENRVRKTTFDLGTACHTAILEPDKFESELSVIPPEVLGKNGARSTNAYKAWLAEQPDDKAIVSQEQREMVLRIRDSVLVNPAHSKARELLTGGMPEVSVFWEELFKGDEVDDETGYHRMESHTYDDPDGCHTLTMKARPDYIPANLITVDLKTTATPIDQQSFERQAYNLKYHWSAGLTLRGLTMATGKQHRIYIFVVVEITPPNEVAVFRAAEENIALGKKEVMETMQRVAWCDKKNKWPGAPNRIQQVGLPGYAYKKLQNGGV